MNANELRIGNLIQWESTGDIESVIDIRTSGLQYHTINDINIKDCKPIPLTEKWLLMFGFKKLGSIVFQCDHFRLFEEDGIFYFHSAVIETEIKFVHQLQNLYFALTNTELEVK